MPYLRHEPVLTAQPANLCDPSCPSPQSGTQLKRGSDTAMEGKGQFRRRFSNVSEEDGWLQLLVKESQIRKKKSQILLIPYHEFVLLLWFSLSLRLLL